MPETPKSSGPSARPLPYRWILPVLELLICFLTLWPVRWYLAENIELTLMLHSSRPPGPQTAQNIVIPPNSASGAADSSSAESQKDSGQRSVDDELDSRMQVPTALNLPAFFIQLPHIMLTPDKREWRPEGMTFIAWRSMSLPVLGVLFWWSAGRGFEAFLSAFRKRVDPRIHWVEAVFAMLIFVFGAVLVIGVLSSPLNDRKDLFIVASGGALWAAMALPMIIAKFKQRKLQKETAANAVLAP